MYLNHVGECMNLEKSLNSLFSWLQILSKFIYDSEFQNNLWKCFMIITIVCKYIYYSMCVYVGVCVWYGIIKTIQLTFKKCIQCNVLLLWKCIKYLTIIFKNLITNFLMLLIWQKLTNPHLLVLLHSFIYIMYICVYIYI